MPKEANKKQSKEKKHFMKDFKAELKKVIWPTPKQLLNNTVAVIVVVLITAIIVFALDFTFEKLNEHGIEKIKTIVESTNTVEDSAQNSEAESNATDDGDANATQDTNSEVLQNDVNE